MFQKEGRQFSEFLTRHIFTLKEIIQKWEEYGQDMTIDRLSEAMQLLKKKFCLHLDGNSEQYHDYIQDFYDSQMERLRKQIYGLQRNLREKDKEIEELIYENRIISQNAQFRNGPSEEQRSELVKAKRELAHCQELIKENSLLIQEQSYTIQELVEKVGEKEAKIQKWRKEYEGKILLMDEAIRANNDKFNRGYRSIQSESRQMGQSMKECWVQRMKAVEEKEIIEREMAVKIEQIKLLTKKIYESSLIIGKMERELGSKTTLIEQLYQQIQQYERAKESSELKQEKAKKDEKERRGETEEWKRKIKMKDQLINEMEQKINQVSERNRKAEEQCDWKRKQNEKIIKQYEEARKNIEKLEKQFKQFSNQNSESDRLKSEIMKLKKEVKLGEEKYSQLLEDNYIEKERMKNDIMVEIGELASLNKKQEKDIQELSRKLEEEKGKNSKLQKKNLELQKNSQNMGIGLDEIEDSLQRIQKEKSQLEKVKKILQAEVQNLKSQIEDQKISFSLYKAEKERENQDILGKNIQLIKSNERYEEELAEMAKKLEQQKKQKNNDSDVNNQKTESLRNEIEKLKELLTKKDFQIKQLESKLKILQEEVRNSDKVYEKEKAKMGIRIRQLEELLKETYEYTSRLSQPASSK